MKLSDLTSRELYLKPPLRFSFTALLIAVVACVLLLNGSTAGLFGVGPSAVQAAPDGVQDELQVDAGKMDHFLMLMAGSTV